MRLITMLYDEPTMHRLSREISLTRGELVNGCVHVPLFFRFKTGHRPATGAVGQNETSGPAGDMPGFFLAAARSSMAASKGGPAKGLRYRRSADFFVRGTAR